MPYASKAQQGFFHTQTAADKGITPETVNEFDQASKGMKLPQYAAPQSSSTKPARQKLAAKLAEMAKGR